MLDFSSISIKHARKLRAGVVVLLSLMSFILIVSIYMYLQIEPLVASRLRETISTSSNGLYEISFRRLNINPFTGNVVMKDIVFKPDLKVFNKFKNERINPSHLFEVRVATLRLKRVHPLKAYFKKELEINEIYIQKPSVRVYYDRTLEKDSTKVDNRTGWQRLSKYLRSIKVKRVLFEDINFRYMDRRLKKPEINSIRNLSVSIQDILIDSLSHLDKSRFYYTKNISAEISDNQFPTTDRMYTVKFDKLEMSTQGSFAMVKGLKLIPNYPDIAFSLKSSYRKSRYTFGVQEVWLKGIDYKRLTEKRQLHANSLQLLSASLDVFMNRQLPKKAGDHGENFPQLMLKELRLTSTVDTVEISNSAFSYTEYNPYTFKRGQISFIGLNGRVINLSNDSTWVKKHRWASGRFSGFAYGKGRLDFDISVNLNSPTQEYHYSGKLHRMHARHFNRITRPLALLDISSGEALDARFSVRGDYRKALGEMTIRYNDLNIGILKVNRNKKLQRSTLMSLVANNLLLIEDNPVKGGSLRKGIITYERPDSISFYSMIWNTLYVGIKQNIGMTPEREQALKQQFDRLKREGPVKTKEERKAQRLERRTRRQNKKLKRPEPRTNIR